MLQKACFGQALVEVADIPSNHSEPKRMEQEQKAILELVTKNDENATRIWLEHAHALNGELSGTRLVPLYRCFSPRAEAPAGFSQLTASLLFVGINPATPRRKEGWNLELFNWTDTPPLATIERLKAYETHAECAYKRHFEPYKLLSEAVQNVTQDWAHIDMFLVRHSSQPEVAKLLYEGPRGRKQMRPFFAEQLEQFAWTLQAHSPRVVVIANRGASNIALRELALLMDENDPCSRYPLYRWDRMPGVPFVLGSMLTGRGALKGERLREFSASIRRALMK